MISSDERLRAAAKIAGDAILASYIAGAEADHQFSPEFERKMDLLIQQTKEKPRYTVLQKVASVILAITLGTGVWLAVDTDARAAVFGWIRAQYENVFHYYFEGNADTSFERSYELGWLPEGYSFLQRSERNGSTTVIYTNESGNIIALTYKTPTDSGDSDFFLMGESETIKSVKICDVSAQLYLTNVPDDSNAIVWADTNSTRLFIITAIEDERTLIKMAENVKEIKK